jgi:hypothetical protein
MEQIPGVRDGSHSTYVNSFQDGVSAINLDVLKVAGCSGSTAEFNLESVGDKREESIEWNQDSGGR